MANGRTARQIKQIRNEILIALKTVYPAAMQAEQVLRSLLALFPTLEFDHVKRDLHYLAEKGYLARVVAELEGDERLTPCRKRWFRLTSKGMEIADHCITDPALEES
ncbi:MAG: hypothetical protein IT449_03720 [Phycisphaerales bacterium]|nr:hypothetical protein [Phycisphaerales bacterium]